MLTLATDKNVDMSISYFKKIFPIQIRQFVAIYLKYAQISAKQFESLKTGEERLKVRNLTSFDSLKSLSFDKFIYALDKDTYIDFINEINNTQNNEYFDGEFGDWGTREVESAIGMINCKLGELKYKFMIHPSTGIRRLAQTNRPDQIPLIKIEPRVYINGPQKKFEPETGGDLYYSVDQAPSFLPKISNIYLDVTIDIESLFDVINFLVYCEVREPKNWAAGYDILNIITKIEKLNEEEKGRIIETVSDTLAKRLFYSSTITFLATITKISNAKVDFFGDLADNILNSCRSTLMDNYDADGNDAGVNEGTILRNTAINIRDLLNSLAAWNGNDYRTAELLKGMIQYLFTLKYTTFNFVKVPYNNLKHKELELIAKLAKIQSKTLSKENALDLSLAFEGGVRNNKVLDFKKNAFYFLPMETLKIDGLYAITKRMYDCGKDFVDCFSKFIIIKKRMADTAEINIKDGSNVDRIGKTYDDYKTYLKKTYNEIKSKLNILSERVLTITKGRSKFSFLESTVGSSPDSKISNINSIIYGITAEAVPISVINYWDDEYYLTNPDASLMDEQNNRKDKLRPWENICANRIISDINEIFKYTNTKESKYMEHTSVGTEMNEVRYASLIDSWLKFNQVIGYDIMDTPYRNMKSNLTVILRDSFSYITTSISEMSPNVENIDPSLRFREENINEKRSFWGWNNFNNDETLKEDESIFSVEELENRVNEYEKFIQGREDEDDDSGEENVFGMFTDFMGMPLGNDITVHELHMQAEEEANPAILHDANYVTEREKFKALKSRYDNILASHF